jgi:hypothetical protein
MTSLWQLPVVVTTLLTWLATAPSSIGDAAFRETLRRQVTAKSVRAYTNRDLPQVSFAPPPQRASSFAADDGDVVRVDMKNDRHDEKWWRDRMTSIRADLDRDETLVEAMQTRVNSLTNDIVRRDDPFQQAALRGQLEFKSAGGSTYLLSGNYSNNDATVGAWQHQSTTLGGATGDVSLPLGPNEQSDTVNCDPSTPGGDPRPAPGTDCFGYTDTDDDPWAGDYDRHGKVETKAYGGALHADWPIGDLSLVSITAYQRVERLQSEDTDAGPNPFIMPTFMAATDTFTQEFRLSGDTDRMRWLLGAFYFNNKVDGHYLLDLTNLGFVYFDANYNQDAESYAAFGQLEYDLSDQFTVILGLRWANETKELDYLNIETTGLYEQIIGTDVAFDFSPDSVGDLAKQDEDGYFWYAGRADDVIISAGYRIGPFEVESACIEHPAVREAAAVASPDAKRGHVVKAFVVLGEGHQPSEELAGEIKTFVRGHLSAYAYPRRIEFVDDLPKTLTGKIRRIELRQQEIEDR